MSSGNKICKSSKGVLVLNLSDAKIPGVVRVDLSALPFTNFHVRSGTEGSVLGYNDSEGRFTALALFADRALADKALHKIENELLNASPKIGGTIMRVSAIVVGVFIVLLVLNWIVGIVLQVSTDGPSSPPAAVSGESAPAGGLPMDADSKFGGQK